MKDLILKNRYTLLLAVLSFYVLVVVLEGIITDRQPDWLRMENSLFSVDLRDLDEWEDIDL